MRLQDSQVERLSRIARRLHRSPGEAAAVLVEEALRMAEFAMITFRDSPVGRQAYTQGSSLAVWEVMQVARAYNHDLLATAEHLQWPGHRVQAAFNYAAAFSEEIDAAIRDNDSYDQETLSRLLPQTRAFPGDSRGDPQDPVRHAASAAG
jgi:hypothetical protein